MELFGVHLLWLIAGYLVAVTLLVAFVGAAGAADRERPRPVSSHRPRLRVVSGGTPPGHGTADHSDDAGLVA